MPPLFYVSYAAMWILLLILSILVLLIYRHFGLLQLGTVEGVQRDGLDVGESAPSVRGVTAQGNSIEWVPQPAHTYLLTFVSATCEPCAKILPSILQFAALTNEAEVILIVDGSRERTVQLIEKFHPPSSVLCIAEKGSITSLAYKVRVAPFAFLIGKDGRIYGKSLCDTVVRLQYLLETGGLKLPEKLLETV